MIRRVWDALTEPVIDDDGIHELSDMARPEIQSDVQTKCCGARAVVASAKASEGEAWFVVRCEDCDRELIDVEPTDSGDK